MRRRTRTSDQMLYMVAGEAMLSLGGHEQPIRPGGSRWFRAGWRTR